MVPIRLKDKKRYVLGERRDYEILGKIYELEKHKLTLKDREVLKLVRTQLERDWRKPLLRFLGRLASKYKKRPV